MRKNSERVRNVATFNETLFEKLRRVLHPCRYYEEAIACLQAVLEETPDFDQAWFVHHLVASCWDRMHRKGTLSFEEAKPFVLEACAKLEAVNPNSPAKAAAEQLVEKYSKN